MYKNLAVCLPSTDSVNENVVLMMMKTMKKDMIVQRIMDWWCDGFFRINFQDAAEVYSPFAMH